MLKHFSPASQVMAHSISQLCIPSMPAPRWVWGLGALACNGTLQSCSTSNPVSPYARHTFFTTCGPVVVPAMRSPLCTHPLALAGPRAAPLPDKCSSFCCSTSSCTASACAPPLSPSPAPCTSMWPPLLLLLPPVVLSLLSLLLLLLQGGLSAQGGLVGCGGLGSG